MRIGATCYWQGYYDTMDAGILMDDGNIAVMARSDDVINVAGHRLSTGALEEVLHIKRMSWTLSSLCISGKKVIVLRLRRACPL